jgi:acetyltransferase-like isoleucine patch superfamily enzyme
MLLFFKLIRKASIYLKSFYRFIKWTVYKGLYPKRLSAAIAPLFGKGFEIIFDQSTSSVELGTNIVFRRNAYINASDNGVVKIGANNFFNNDCSITCKGRIAIGNNNQFGEGVKLYDHNHAYKLKDVNINEQGYTVGTIIIGNNCWIGSNVIILKDVTIGDNVVIGAGCLIHKSVPSNTTVINKQVHTLL